MNPPSFDSYSQNGEDVVLWRALGDVHGGRYVDVGANHPVDDSVTYAFYERGWSGITVEPDPHFAALQRERRPRDRQIEAAVSGHDGPPVTFHVVDGTGLSTLDDAVARDHATSGRDTHDITVARRRLDSVLEEAGWSGLDIHLLSVDTEGSEREVLEGIDLAVWRPWVMVVEATAPNSSESTRHRWEDLVRSAGYQFCLFDGLSCFYVADEHARRLAPALGYPACILDRYTTQVLRHYRTQAEAVPQLVREVARWRGQATAKWAAAVAAEAQLVSLREERGDLAQRHDTTEAEAEALRRQVGELRNSTSWRVTRPLRTASSLLARARSSR